MLEERLLALEQQVRELKEKLRDRAPPPKEDEDAPKKK